MLLRETGFSFNGIHSREDMGLQYVEKDGHPFLPETERNAYDIAGSSGSVLFEGETLKPITFTGSLFPLRERANQAEAQALLRRVAAWLGAGRRRLIFDYEPEIYYMAEVDAGSKWSLKSWFGGEISLRFEAQPYAYSVTPARAVLDTADTEDSAVLTLDTGFPAPLCATVVNTGTATITGFQLGEGVIFEGLELEPDDWLQISMETPIGAEMGLGDSPPESALPFASAFRPLLLGAGTWRVGVGLTYGSSGTPGARVTLSARARW